MTMHYISTRGGGEPQTFDQVLLTGLAPDGGLYIPQEWPQIDLESLKGKSYQDIAEIIMAPFTEGSIKRETLRTLINDAYAEFRHKDIVPPHKLNDNLYTLELFHGPTIAFKDVALQMLGRLFEYVLKKEDKHVTIVGATSGDTGSAAIEGCRHSEHVDIFILFPDGRVSDVQRKQMTTVKGDNVHNIALEGTFDDCQNAVKAMFNDPDFRADMSLSAINSINWARIMAQIVYYFTTYVALGSKPLSFVVPTGNFGNIYAAYCARQMGLPINTLAVATNKNDILTRFFESGKMDMQGVEATLSPSMDIQISSNFERYLFDAFDRDAEKLKSVMQNFKDTGHFDVDSAILEKAQQEFKAFRANDLQTLDTITKIYREYDYILDPHTAVGMKGALELQKELAEDQDSIIVSLACAHPAKFPDAVEKSIGIRPPLPEHLSDLFDREERMTKLPNDLETIKDFIRTTRHA